MAEDGTAHTQHCLLCNKEVLEHHPSQSTRSYLSNYRTIFTTPISRWTRPRLSDPVGSEGWTIGIPGYMESSNRRTQYWMNDFYDPATEWTVARNHAFLEDCIRGGVYYSAGRFQNAVWVLPFHDCCWKVLEDAASRLIIPLDTQAIYDVAMTFHYEDTVRNYKFVYGNYLPANQTNVLPSDIPQCFDTFTPARAQDWQQDNLPTKVLNRIHRDVKRIQRFSEPLGKGLLLKRTHTMANYRVDPFSKLPPELHQSIFMELSLDSLFNLRVASRSCAAVTVSSNFFKAELDPRGPFGYVLSDADIGKDVEGRWRYTFDCALKLNNFGVLKERKISWNASIDLLDLVSLRLEAPSCKGSEGYNRKGGQLGQKYTPPRQNYMSILPGEDPGVQHHRWLEIGKPLEKVYISIMRLHEREFVTGLSFHYEDGTKGEIGYIHPKTAVTAWWFAKAQTRNINRISVATDAMGVRGIRFHHKGPWIWAGDSDGYKVDRRNLRLRRYTAFDIWHHEGRFLEASFDNLKMCDIA